MLYCSRGDTVCARVTTEAYGIPKPLTGTVHIECGEDVASQRGGEARDAASSGVGRIRNGHAHGLNDPRARLHGDEGLVLVGEALAQIVILTEHRAVAFVRNDTEPFRTACAVTAKFVQRDGEESVASSPARRLVSWAPGIAQYEYLMIYKP